MIHRRSALGLKDGDRPGSNAGVHRIKKIRQNVQQHTLDNKQINRAIQNLDKISGLLVQCDKIAGLSFSLCVHLERAKDKCAKKGAI